jgi:hypothetical protein
MGMTSRFAHPYFARPRRAAATRATVAAAAFAALIVVPAAGAASRHAHERTGQEAAPRAAGAPIMAIVSLKRQRVTLYDADGWILRAPVSSGMHGRETPAGVFSVIQKDKDHHSNLYDDASMPNMLRITWSGIALHGGPLPGHAASHGCVRMPYGFAEHLFGEVKLGMRVVIASGDAAPVDIADPKLFSPKPDAEAHAKALADAAAGAAKAADAARLAAVTATREAAQASAAVRKLETLKARADAQFAAADRAAAAATTDDAKAKTEAARQKAAAAVADAQTQLDAARAQAQPKLDAVAPARATAADADNKRTAAAKAAREAVLAAVSVFISRKTQRLYVRRGFQPLFDAPITIRDPDQPIGTHVFTAVARTDAGLRWNVVTIDGANDARAALDRIDIPPDVLARFASTAAVRSSLVISDEPLSGETGEGTEFVAVLSDAPQGGLAMRKHPSREVRYARRQNTWSTDGYGGQGGNTNYYGQRPVYSAPNPGSNWFTGSTW